MSTIVGMGEGRRKLLETCTPGYYNAEGRVSDGLVRALPYGAGPVAFIQLLKAWREQGDFEGLELDGVPAPARPTAPAV